MNPGITLDQFALAVELVDNYKTDSYDLEYPGLIMTIRFTDVTFLLVVECFLLLFHFLPNVQHTVQKYLSQ